MTLIVDTKFCLQRPRAALALRSDQFTPPGYFLLLTGVLVPTVVKTHDVALTLARLWLRIKNFANVICR